jgi:hypothetical protein
MKFKIIGKKAGWLRWIGSIGVLTSVGVGTVSPVLAYRVSSVRVPNVLKLPRDGRLYPFTVFVEGEYSSKDFGEGSLSLDAEFWDENEFGPSRTSDRPLDKLPQGNSLPKPSSNTKKGDSWSVELTFSVGCMPGGAVFGPSGKTDEKNVEGFLTFGDNRERRWGTIYVSCEEGESAFPAFPLYP